MVSSGTKITSREVKRLTNNKRRKGFNDTPPSTEGLAKKRKAHQGRTYVADFLTKIIITEDYAKEEITSEQFFYS